MYAVNYLAHNWLAKKLINNCVRRHLIDLHGTVIDLGCGTRPYAREILSYADRHIGVDWQNSLHRAQPDIVADLNKPLPLQDEAIDCVVAFEVLEHIAEPAVMLAEANRILRPNGRLLLSVPFQWWIHEAPWDYQRFTRYGLEYQLRKAGFTSISIHPTSGFWSMWILKLNYQLVRLVRGPRLIRIIIRLVLIPIWWSGQALSPLLDGHWPDDRETVGYVASANKEAVKE